MSTKFESTCMLKSLHRIETQLNMVMVLLVTIGLLIFHRLKKALINTPGLYAPAIVSLVELMYKLHDKTQALQEGLTETHADRLTEEEGDNQESEQTDNIPATD